MVDTKVRSPLLEAAEAEKFKSEALLATAQAAVHDVEARKLRAEAETAEIALERERRKERTEMAKDAHHHVHTISESISAGSVKTTITQLTEWMRNAPGCEIEIVFNSPGGSVIDGMALWDFLTLVKGRGHHLTTTCLGMAASMAGILLQAGDHRVIGRESYVLIHEVSFGAGGKIGEVEDEVEFVRKIQDRVLDIFAARSTLTKRQIANRWRRKDWWLDSEECLRLGFADEAR